MHLIPLLYVEYIRLPDLIDVIYLKPRYAVRIHLNPLSPRCFMGVSLSSDLITMGKSHLLEFVPPDAQRLRKGRIYLPATHPLMPGPDFPDVIQCLVFHFLLSLPPFPVPEHSLSADSRHTEDIAYFVPVPEPFFRSEFFNGGVSEFFFMSVLNSLLANSISLFRYSTSSCFRPKAASSSEIFFSSSLDR